MSPLHSYLRILDWFLNVIYRVAAGKNKWSEDQKVRDYRYMVCHRINEITNFYLINQVVVETRAQETWREYSSHIKAMFYYRFVICA